MVGRQGVAQGAIRPGETSMWTLGGEQASSRQLSPRSDVTQPVTLSALQGAPGANQGDLTYFVSCSI